MALNITATATSVDLHSKGVQNTSFRESVTVVSSTILPNPSPLGSVKDRSSGSPAQTTKANSFGSAQTQMTSTTVAFSIDAVSASPPNSSTKTPQISSLTVFQTSTSLEATLEMSTASILPTVSTEAPSGVTTTSLRSEDLFDLPSQTSTTAESSNTAITGPHQPDQKIPDGPASIPAAIAIGSLLGLAVLLTLSWLIFRHCRPVKRRWEARQERIRLKGLTQHADVRQPMFDAN